MHHAMYGPYLRINIKMEIIRGDTHELRGRQYPPPHSDSQPRALRHTT